MNHFDQIMLSDDSNSLWANPLPRRPGQVKLDSTSENYERICLNKKESVSKFGFWATVIRS